MTCRKKGGCHCASPGYCKDVAKGLYQFLEALDVHDNDKGDIALLIEKPKTEARLLSWTDGEYEKLAKRLRLILRDQFQCENIRSQVGLDLASLVEFHKRWGGRI
jgi:hypothetical protein